MSENHEIPYETLLKNDIITLENIFQVTPLPYFSTVALGYEISSFHPNIKHAARYTFLSYLKIDGYSNGGDRNFLVLLHVRKHLPACK